MSQFIQSVLNSDEKTDLRQFASEVHNQSERYLLRNDILSVFDTFCEKYGKTPAFQLSSRLQKLIYYTQEILVEDENLYLIIRPKIASEEAYRLDPRELVYERIQIDELLDLRDRFVGHYHPQEGDILEIDFRPFYDYSPVIRDPKNIGRGVQYLNRYLSSKMFEGSQQWLFSLFSFLKLHSYNGTQLLINQRIQNPEQLSECVKQAISLVGGLPPEQPYPEFRFNFQELGFEPGWGNTAARVLETLEMLDELIDSPDDQVLEAFISRIPMIFKIVLVSIHGYFGQEGFWADPILAGRSFMSLIKQKA